MNKFKYFAFFMMSMIVILLSTVIWPMPVGATSLEIITPSAEEDGIKNIIKEYFEIRYRAFNTLQLDGFGNLISNQPKVNTFLDAELSKLAVEIKHAELNHLRYMDYKFFLDYKNIIIDSSTQTATVSLSLRHDVVYEISVELDPVNPIISHMYNLEHATNVLLPHHPPFSTFTLPVSGPVGSSTGPVGYLPSQSLTHSITLPAMSIAPTQLAPPG
jgi:hypothetical protein